ncbi:hypothetical protein CYR55_03480 [Chimaeribacter californicus]|uniref:Uncharacterized protein n=1 Tax=Chimaeribacter californicus TaxID=2060067 RepID=A0A2N5EER1_9GAMM|nr:hypothetical protein CYR55_03480 [Chimaeribacter californicus]
MFSTLLFSFIIYISREKSRRPAVAFQIAVLIDEAGKGATLLSAARPGQRKHLKIGGHRAGQG